MHEHDPVGDLAGKADLVRHQHHGHAVARHLLQHLQHFADQLGIERRGDLVEQHDLRLHGERAGDRHPLLLAARELVGIGVDLLGKSHLAQHRFGELARFGGRHVLHHLGRQGDVLLDAEMGEEVETLEHDADMLAQLAQVGARIVHHGAVERHRAALDRLQAVHAAQHGALARAGAADDGDDLALLDFQRHAVQHRVLPVALDDVCKFNERHGASARAAGTPASAGSRARSRWRLRSGRR